MAEKLIPLHGPSVEASNYVGTNSEISIDSGDSTLMVHDGVTPGGHKMAKKGDLGTAANRDVGTAPDEVPLNSDLGSASLVNVGYGDEEVQTNELKEFKSFDSLTSAVSFVSASPGSLENITTASYRSKSECDSLGIDYPDGGGADYIVEALGTPDGYGDHAAGTKQLTLNAGMAVSAKVYGAVLDGIVNSSASIQAMTTKGIIPIIPLNSIALVSDIDLKGVSIRGEGWSSVLKLASTAASGLMFDTTIARITLDNLTLDGDSQSGYGYNFLQNNSVTLNRVHLTNWNVDRVAYTEQGTSNLNVSDCIVSDCAAADVFVAKSNINSVTTTVFIDCADHVVRFGRFGGDPATDAGTQSTVDNCHFMNIGNDAVLFELNSQEGVVSNCTGRNIRRLVKADPDILGPSGKLHIHSNTIIGHTGVDGAAISVTSCEDAIITNNYIEGYPHGITAGTRSKVANNVLVDIGGIAIRMYGDHSDASHNSITGHTGTSHAMLFDGANNNASFNDIETTGATGIRAGDAKNRIVHNSISSAAIGVNITPGVGGSKVTDNDLSSCATPLAGSAGYTAKRNDGAADSYFNGAISSGVITISQFDTYANVDTEGGAADDDLDTINGGFIGQAVIVQSTNTESRDVTVKNATGNIRLATGDVILSNTTIMLRLVFNGTHWCG